MIIRMDKWGEIAVPTEMYLFCLVHGNKIYIGQWQLKISCYIYNISSTFKRSISLGQSRIKRKLCHQS